MSKTIYDSIHGSMNISKLAQHIINNKIFNRLRNLKQLGLTYLVFPNAVHTRFEHSLGTYHLTNKFLNNIKSNTDKLELDKLEINDKKVELNDRLIELISIGGLCHDLGHGPFSHVFDDVYIKMNISDNNPNNHHEYRSCKLLELIYNDDEYIRKEISSEELEFIFTLINPDKNMHKGWAYQLISNNLNSLDVDKYDYLTRDSKMLGIPISFNLDRVLNNAKIIDNNICYSKNIDVDIINLFQSRHYLHRKVYLHKITVAADFMMNELLKDNENILRIRESLIDLNKFIRLTDDYVMIMCEMFGNKDVIDRYIKHDFYKLVSSYTSKDKYDNFDDFDDNKDGRISRKYKSNEYIIGRFKIGYISGNKKNPLDDIYLYKSKNNDVILLKDSNTTILIPENYQEYITMIYLK
jgi:HD superfamily phosphohydrolase